MDNSFDEIMKNIPLRLCNKCDKCNGKLPTSPWDEMPEDCGFNGWLFQKREEIMKNVRKVKEELILLEIAHKTLSGAPLYKVEARIEEIKNFILAYSNFGSKNW